MNKICITLKNNKKMYVELYEEIAPITVANFLHLIDEKFFDGIVFHRIIKDFMCQAGGYYIQDDKYINKVGIFVSNYNPIDRTILNSTNNPEEYKELKDLLSKLIEE